MPAHGAERPFVCRSHFSRNTGQIHQVRSRARMHQQSSSVAGGASWHTVRAFSNEAVVVEKDGGRAQKGRV